MLLVRVASVSDEPSNAASEALLAAYARLELGPFPTDLVRATLTDDFTYEDRRSGPTLPEIGAEYFPKVVNSHWETGAAARPRFKNKTLAVRGERFAAVAIQVDYDGMLIESIDVIGRDATLRLLQRVVSFDRDDLDGAIAELDRLQSQTDAS